MGSATEQRQQVIPPHRLEKAIEQEVQAIEIAEGRETMIWSIRPGIRRTS